MERSVFGTIFFLLAVTVNAEKVTVTTIVEPPYVEKIDPNGSGNDNFKGMIPEMMTKLADELDIEYEMKEVEDKKYGENTGQGQWSGMIGEIKTRKAQIAAAPITISDERKEVVEFTTPFLSIETTLLALKPKEGEELPFKDAKTLADQTEIKYGVVKDGMTENFFKTSEDPTYKKMWGVMDADQSVLVANNKEGVEKVRNSDGKFVFIIESSTAEYWVNREPCNLEQVSKISKVDGSVSHYGFALPKGSQYTEKLSNAIQAMKDSGEIAALKTKYWKGDCNSSAVSVASSLALSAAALLFARFI